MFVRAAASPIAAVTLGTTTVTTAQIFLAAINTLSSLFTVKNEGPKIVQRIIEKITNKRDNDPLEQLKRVERAYYLICFTAFFEALCKDKVLASCIKKAKMSSEEKIAVAASAVEKLGGEKDILGEDLVNCTELKLINAKINLPHPAETFEQQENQLLPLYKELALSLENFLKSLVVIWDNVYEKERENIKQALNDLPTNALAAFRSEYFFLATKYEEFYVWSNLHEHKETRKQLNKLSTFTQQYVALAESGQTAIDVGFKSLTEVISQIPMQNEQRHVSSILQTLETLYRNSVEDPVIEETDPKSDSLVLTFPRKKEIFIPQSFKVIRYSGEEALEDEATWKNLPLHHNLNAFFISYLNHPISGDAPLIILGQPGSGKSLLTTMLAARWNATNCTPIRVILRKINADSDITDQIERQIESDTNGSIDWMTLTNHFKTRPALVLFDGYDELLQASGKVFAYYPRKVQQFQIHQHKKLERAPIRAIITSRITLIDKAEIPINSTIILLQEFDEKKQQEWIKRWNAANVEYFQRANIEKFSLPLNNENVKILSGQPLLLMMLAIYDSAGNQLRKAKALDQSLLYNDLLRRFIKRELEKEPEKFLAQKGKSLDDVTEYEMERLGVAAISMFNRRTLYVQAAQLNTDLHFFERERIVQETDGRRLSQAEILFGSFFFVQKSEATHKTLQKSDSAQKLAEKERDIAFEFLHTTFGEFLTADFILRKLLAETEYMSDLNQMYQQNRKERFKDELSKKTKQINGLEPGWFARFIYTPLFSRPVIVSLMRQWIQHCLINSNRSIESFLEDLDRIVTDHINLLLNGNILPEPMIKNEQHLFTDLPITGYLAIYTLNLILLRTLLAPDGYIFKEELSPPSMDGTRAWDRLSYLWRSWFSFETLNELAALLTAERKGTEIHLKIKDTYFIPISGNRLRLIYNVSQAVADDITSGLAGFCLHDSFKIDKDDLDAIRKKLLSEQIDLEFALLTKRLRKQRQEHKFQSKELFSTMNGINTPLLRVKSYSEINLEYYIDLLNEITKFIEESGQTNTTPFGGILRPIPIELITDELALVSTKLALLTSHRSAFDYYTEGYVEHLRKVGKELSNYFKIELRDILVGYVNRHEKDRLKEDRHPEILISRLSRFIKNDFKTEEKKILR